VDQYYLRDRYYLGDLSLQYYQFHQQPPYLQYRQLLQLPLYYQYHPFRLYYLQYQYFLVDLFVRSAL
jgi:hypothetical protein